MKVNRVFKMVDQFADTMQQLNQPRASRPQINIRYVDTATSVPGQPMKRPSKVEFEGYDESISFMKAGKKNDLEEED